MIELTLTVADSAEAQGAVVAIAVTTSSAVMLALGEHWDCLSVGVAVVSINNDDLSENAEEGGLPSATADPCLSPAVLSADASKNEKPLINATSADKISDETALI